MAKKLQIVSARPFQADWNMMDENDMTYIKNKPNVSETAKIKNVILYASLWNDEIPYSQPISLDVTPNSKIDIQPSVDVVTILSGNTKLLFKNDNGNVTAYAINAKPVADLNLQVTITEVEKENDLDVVWGNII